MKDQDLFTHSDDLVARPVGEETILVPVRNNVGDLDSVYTLTTVGARIWSMLDGRTTITQVVDRICEEYDVTSETAERDVTEFLSLLEAADLVRKAEAS